ncbi:type IV toxin-antitoxin system AbiEi family antitoxin domain-containing protein [Phycicoccus jejuensis]|uniref:hypothetical protein n=1 Tax=Phycicoccus jejuensis TaxID=367299 RepID=UPI00384CBEA2
MANLPTCFTRAEALADGWSARRLDAAVLGGRLERIVPGLYADADAWSTMPPWDRHRAIARTASRTTPDAIISHASAAALLGLPMPPHPPQLATLTLLDDSRTSREDSWRRFHRGATPPSHVWIRKGTPFLDPARTVVDCLRDMRPGDALAVVDAALRRGLVTSAGLAAMREHQRRWPGIAVADLLLALADGRRESWLESVSAYVFASWEAPPGVPQVVVRDEHGRFVARVDVGWEGLGVVGEADGRGKYLLDAPPDVGQEEAAARKVVAQGVRESRLRDLGLEVLRWETADVLGRQEEFRERWESALGRARPDVVTARFECSCCARPPTDCASATRTDRFRGS